jgi:murein tripeptide amidase MpaA
VHPGESNSSFIVQGIIDYLLSDEQGAKDLREKFVFKIIPMLNPDGVRYGNYRCDIFGYDLNRKWKGTSE